LACGANDQTAVVIINIKMATASEEYLLLLFIFHLP